MDAAIELLFTMADEQARSAEYPIHPLRTMPLLRHETQPDKAREVPAAQDHVGQALRKAHDDIRMATAGRRSIESRYLRRQVPDPPADPRRGS